MRIIFDDVMAGRVIPGIKSTPSKGKALLSVSGHGPGAGILGMKDRTAWGPQEDSEYLCYV